MPFKSKSQRRYFYAAEAKGDLPKGTAKRWEKHTKNKNLPEHVKTAAAVNKPPIAPPVKSPVDTSFSSNVKGAQALSDSVKSTTALSAMTPDNLRGQLTSAAGMQSMVQKFKSSPSYNKLTPGNRATIDSAGANLAKGRQWLSNMVSSKSKTDQVWSATKLVSSKNKLAAPVNRAASFIKQTDSTLYNAYRDSSIARGGAGWKADSMPPTPMGTDTLPATPKRGWFGWR